MQHHEIRLFSGLARGCAAAAALLIAACHPSVVNHPGSDETNGVTVSGQGEASAPPDLARVEVGVEVRGATVEAVTTENTARMTRLRAALQTFGIDTRDLQTTAYHVSYEENPPVPPPPPPAPPPGKVAGTFTQPAPPAGPQGFHRAVNMLEVTVRRLDQLGDILAAATRDGGNRVNGIRFEIADPSKIEAVAREKAVADARSRAEALARLSGVKLGKVVSINEGGGGVQPFYKESAAYAGAADTARVPVESGDVKANLQVQIVYEILKD